MTFTSVDYQYMARALDLARRGLFTTDPNPRVGCVLVRDGEIVGEGWHRRTGESHAERHALDQAGERARGAACYVTLEPCSHLGRTGPCADALIEAGVSRVIVAMRDPNPQVAGQGFEKLRAAGIEVQAGLCELEARDLNPGFIKRMETGRPWVRVKLAMGVDGRTAMASGESQWITGGRAREDVQRLRARSSVIITGIGTVLADDPSLTVRPHEWRDGMYGHDSVRQPLRVVLDRGLRMSPGAAILRQQADTRVMTQADPDGALGMALREAGAEVQRAPGSGSGLDLEWVLDELGRCQCNEVLVEAGPTLAGAFVREELFDELVIYMAPVLMGCSARPLLALPQIGSMAERIALSLSEVQQFGDDLRLTFRAEKN